MNGLHFLRPQFFFLFIPLIVLLLFYFFKKKRFGGWNQVCSKDLYPFVVHHRTKYNVFFTILTFLVLSWLIVAMAGPAWSERSEPVFKKESGLVVILELSDVMNAEDIKPSRLKRAVYKIRDLLENRKDGQTALVVFSEDSFVVTPLTDDVATIQSQLHALETKIMPSDGHHVTKAINKALQLLKQANVKDGSILLLTSQLSDEDLEQTVQIMNDHLGKFFILGVGSENATAVHKPEGGFLKDQSGKMIMTKLPISKLQNLAKMTNGYYETITLDEKDIEAFVSQLSANHLNEKFKETEKSVKKWQDQGYLLVMIILPFILLLFRRGVVLTLFLLISQPVFATNWTDYFESQDVRAETLYHQENYDAAKSLFKNPEWKGCAHYQLQEYDQAIQLFKESQSVKGLYNLGTAQAKKGDFKAALDSYQKVLEMEPDHEDALYNKKLIEDHLKNQDQKNHNSSDQQNNEENKEENSPENESLQNGDKNDKDGSNHQDDSKREQEQENDPSPDQNQENDPSEKEEEQDENESTEQNDEDKTESQESSFDEKNEDENHHDDELQNQVDEKWLQRVKDDPGGLLRRKFLHQYKKRGLSK